MILEYDHSELKLNYETIMEKLLLTNDKLQTKLNYIPFKKNENMNTKSDTFNIHIKGNDFVVDFNNKYGIIGNPHLSNERIGYMLRILIDGYLIKTNNLPLHAALVSTEDKSAFLFANSNGGKSFYANLLSEKYKEIKVIGDDHVIVSKNCFSGNSVFRIRNGNSEKYIKNKNNCTKKKKYYIFDLNIKEKMKNFEIVSINKYLKNDLSQILKYIYIDFETEDKIIKINDLFKEDIKKLYLKEFKNFLENSTAIIKVTGDIEYVIKIISKLII